jgi:hypothetical protein
MKNLIAIFFTILFVLVGWSRPIIFNEEDRVFPEWAGRRYVPIPLVVIFCFTNDIMFILSFSDLSMLTLFHF